MSVYISRKPKPCDRCGGSYPPEELGGGEQGSGRAGQASRPEAWPGPSACSQWSQSLAGRLGGGWQEPSLPWWDSSCYRAAGLLFTPSGANVSPTAWVLGKRIPEEPFLGAAWTGFSGGCGNPVNKYNFSLWLANHGKETFMISFQTFLISSSSTLIL